MAKKILILGNGFDIDLGMKTRYSDFAKSRYWDELMENVYGISQDLLGVLKEAKEKSDWFDIEQVIYDYAAAVSNEWCDATKDKEEFARLVDALANYLQEVQRKQDYNNKSIAFQVLREIVNTGEYHIYTFNYTQVQKVAEAYNLQIDPSAITHMHGSLDNHSIILGILADSSVSISREYSFLYKDNSRFYMPNHMYEDLENARDVVFFGHSINGMDFPYFKNFFVKQSGMNGECKRKNITIFTYDENSDMQIRDSIRGAQVDVTQLFHRNDINFIQTKQLYAKDEIEEEKFQAFIKRIRTPALRISVGKRKSNPYAW